MAHRHTASVFGVLAALTALVSATSQTGDGWMVAMILFLVCIVFSMADGFEKRLSAIEKSLAAPTVPPSAGSAENPGK